MSIFEKNQKLDLNADNGIWLDYKDHVWLFFIKDDVWQKEEVHHVEYSNVNLGFVQKGIVDAFIVEVFDCLEPSDLPFCMKDAEKELLDSLNDKKDYSYEIVLLDGSNTVKAVRDIEMKKENSALLKHKLSARLSEGYTSEDFDKAYAKLEATAEPYELYEKAVFTQEN